MQAKNLQPGWNFFCVCKADVRIQFVSVLLISTLDSKDPVDTQY